MNVKSLLNKCAVILFIICIYPTAKSFACNAFFTYHNACAGDTVFFDGLDQAAVLTWDFGDTLSGTSNVSQGVHSWHVYNTPGTYYVTLFANIGAEWDYRMQTIVVGTDCFNASFSYTCAGSNGLNFVNSSTGDITTLLWNFGEPSSGTNDTSSAFNGNHTYAAPGNYIVTLITSDGTYTDTSIQTVTLNANCLNANFYSFYGGYCVQDTTHITTYYTGNITSYYWNFGDPASGIANFSTDSLGVHLFTQSGTYLVTLIITDGIQTDTFYNVLDVVDCTVWSGNTNRNGGVDMEDLFALGIYYGDTGAVRPSASINWTSQPCTDWGASSWAFMYLTNLLDKKYADCNGDGTVNSADLQAIDLNYARQQPNYMRNDLYYMTNVTPASPTLQLMMPTGNLNAGDTIHIPVYLSAADTVKNVYGLSATILYDAAYILPGSVQITFNNCLIGIAGVDMLSLTKDFSATGSVDIGLVRTNHQQITGNGEVAELTFVLRNSVSGTLNFSFAGDARLLTTSMFNSTAAGNIEIIKDLNLRASSANVVLGMEDFTSDNSISLYPNPTADRVQIKVNRQMNVKEVTVKNYLGQIMPVIISENKTLKTFSLSTRELAKGIYFVSVKSDRGEVMKKLVVE